MPSPRYATGCLIPDSPEFTAFNEYVTLLERKRSLSNELDDVTAQMQALEPQLLASLGEGGYERVRLRGYTISPHREPWVHPKPGFEPADVIRALKASDLAQYVKEVYNTRSLTKYVSDLEQEHGRLSDDNGALETLLPEPLALVLEVRPTFRVQTRKT